MKALHTATASAVAALLAALAPAAALAQGVQLNPAPARISDAAIQADHRAYEGLQARIKALNDKGRPLRDYHLGKAQCWLDVSFHEYTRNDRGPFPQAALTEAERLIAGMEQGAALGSDTALVGQAVRLRPDLWDRVARLKTQAGFRCAQHKVACAEVELVHAGNEHAQQQWRHAQPYVQIAEDLVAEAESLVRSCPGEPVVRAAAAPPPPPPPPAPPPPPPAPPPPAPPPLREVSLLAHVVFAFDRHGEADIRGHSLAQLQSLVDRIRSQGLDVRGIRLTGHADRLNSTGQADYNQRLSEQRVQTVRGLLVRLGLDERLMRTEARGDTQPVESCASATRSQAELRECLLPNRRVEIEIDARARPR